MKLFQTMGYISREKQRSYFDSTVFNTINPHPIVVRLMGQLRLPTRI